ncbi:hypothetical protein [Jannaschia sp. CCS1]|uniref:hypothetical protein n=1 Tax=Jannaschia sp. (strain CCS1) TaxID=290400 RepID=UPI000053A53A|nr:hypothetical protein [Jannaschia sp. CCS1]
MFIRSILTIAVLASFVFGAAANAQTATAHGMIGEPVSFTVETPDQANGPAVLIWLTGDDAADD